MADIDGGDGCPDATMAHFVRALLPSDAAEQVLSGFYTDAFHASLLSRLAALRGSTDRDGRRRVSPLPKWKLRQVEAHVDANIGERITLADLAAAARLSEMHFAAQFRLATGQRPHDFVIHRRIQHARRMMVETQEPIVQVALAVGFQTQAHFTTVFKRVVGLTPHRWRQAELEREGAPHPVAAPASRGDRWAGVSATAMPSA
ncbi:helix-turn-helix transcriptional regulator [Roseomonas sp. HJA6]|uniref:Helix-turn-helix transcriptional regulator n=1 Tax=Roseomonas alba TaxID=2846776 RepID=A0ABS7A592_9PROT|nr:helix-turn-helix domain-containing protein [Neoroseomonas alba]MBW6396902.1 helix-turn-helix transcriptional regulator [Neoroseomonas alba]